jgi:hypothetical protein
MYLRKPNETWLKSDWVLYEKQDAGRHNINM